MPHTPDTLHRLIRRFFMGAALWLGFGLCMALASVEARAGAATEQQIKAAYLYHFTRFVQWPATAFDSPDANFRICLLGTDPFGEQLQALSKRKHNSHPITLLYPQSAREARGCHLLYITADAQREAVILKQSPDVAQLTVSSQAGFAARGGVIGFVMVDKRVRLEINRAAARRANIQLSAKLLEVARVVDEAVDHGEQQP